MLSSLFALTSDPANRIVKFTLTEDVQTDLMPYLQGQEQFFLARAGQEIIFDGKYKPDAQEILIIENYDDIDNLSDAITNPLGYLKLLLRRRLSIALKPYSRAM
ncbi:hypothetical protein SAMN05216412_11252 [Nitrosospira multiformis]|uniref:Uncharacterized protein n=1 Tax=Nitrosospira multiformis TaxID=1231 RepID=A0A1I0GAE7_9PROT|nr:hypothetical protein [Nitrosospira multiformis]SET67675.1 hypothetical protein SAMN05216412_11252 [Nitrosospira multiformis]